MAAAAKNFPEVRSKKRLAGVKLSLGLFSLSLFASARFLNPEASGATVSPAYFIVFLLPAAFFYLFWRDFTAVRKVGALVGLVTPENSRETTIRVLMINYNFRSSRGFDYKVASPANSDALVSPLTHSSDFEMNVGHREEVGERVSPEVGKPLDGIRRRGNPVFRELKLEGRAFSRPGASGPFLFESREGYRFWLPD